MPGDFPKLIRPGWSADTLSAVQGHVTAGAGRGGHFVEQETRFK